MKFRIAIAAAAVAALTAGVTYAATSLTAGSTATSTIEACVKTANGDVRIVDGPAACHRDERSVTWNVQGPKGDKGDKGDKGETGATGSAGLSVEASTLPAGDASCPYGGSTFRVGDASPTFACNGAPGAAGKNGQDGASLASVSDLTGLACRTSAGDPGTTLVSYGSGNTVVLTCAATASGGGGGGGTGVSCTLPPDPPHAAASCDSSGSVQYVCAFGWVDTDGNLANGCEQQLDLQNDPHNCGAPGNDVTLQLAFAHAILGCRNGQPVIATCLPGWSDANGDERDGCELSIPASQCEHFDGLGERFSDCTNTGVIPGNAATYSRQLAMEAAQAWATANGGTTPQLATCRVLGYDVVTSQLPGKSYTVAWSWTGTTAGYVSVARADLPACPTATDNLWY